MFKGYFKIKSTLIILLSLLYFISGTSLFASSDKLIDAPIDFHKGSHEKLLAAHASVLPTGNSSIPKRCSHAVISSPETEEGKYVKSKSWAVTSELKANSFTFVSFAGGMNWLTKNRCSRSESNIAVFEHGQLIQIIYTSVQDDYLIGSLQPIGDRIIQILFSDSRSPIAEIKIYSDRYAIQEVFSHQKFCDETIVVPNIYNKSIEEARKTLLNFGWLPKRHLNKPNYGARSLREVGIIEAKYCEPVGMAECELHYENEQNDLIVHTIGEYGRSVEYFEVKNCF